MFSQLTPYLARVAIEERLRTAQTADHTDSKPCGRPARLSATLRAAALVATLLSAPSAPS